MKISDEQAHVLLHTLGLSDPYQRKMYRNHFVAGPGHADLPHLKALVAAGLMYQRPAPAFCEGTDYLYMATDAGKELAQRIRPRLPERKRRYLAFLSYRDCNQDLTFGEFLKARMYAEDQR